jgi:hypothetical protein
MMVTTTQTNRVEVAGRVSQVVLPADARALGNRSRVDYEDAFIVDAGGRQTAEQWARAVFSDAPLAVRARLVAGWLGLGLKLGGPWSTHRLLGSKVAQIPTFWSAPRNRSSASRPSCCLQPNRAACYSRRWSNRTTPRRRPSGPESPPRIKKTVRSLLDHAARREAGPA